ncbi:hypothetical protein P3342_011825 [Pyrenophora teres f. teres]|nr:hypothetical protein P3342_011825 [Pyrenophora teres f. teres]
MWVFTYKFDEDGYLLKYKARLVVRGDLQEQYGDTYAATLAARLFRALMALACAFNLKAMQYDVPNAFLNANMDRTLYVRTPDGFQDRYGPNLRLLRALYGLKRLLAYGLFTSKNHCENLAYILSKAFHAFG